MGVMENLRSAGNLVGLVHATTQSEKYRSGRFTAYDTFALGVASQVEAGRCDPVVAEASLDSMLQEAKTEYFAMTPAGEKGSKRLASLVMSGDIDPVVAENILDRNFEPWTINIVLDSLQPKR